MYLSQPRGIKNYLNMTDDSDRLWINSNLRIWVFVGWPCFLGRCIVLFVFILFCFFVLFVSFCLWGGCIERRKLPDVFSPLFHFNLDDDPMGGSPVELDSAYFESADTVNSATTGRNLISEKYNVIYDTINLRELKRTGMVTVLRNCIPQDVLSDNHPKHVDCSKSLLIQIQVHFLNWHVNVDEKGLLYLNVKRHRSGINPTQ